jgi:hypothetical protein
MVLAWCWGLFKNIRMTIGITDSRCRPGMNMSMNAAPIQSQGLRALDRASLAVPSNTKARAR